MINKLKEKKGQISVTMVIFIMVLCYMLASMIDIGNRQWGLRETQTKIDIAGMNALYNSVNLDSLRLEAQRRVICFIEDAEFLLSFTMRHKLTSENQ